MSPRLTPGLWLVKQDPADYSWERFVSDGATAWTGVRSFAARKHLRTMAAGDLVLFYHSGTGKEVVGVARVAEGAYPDPTAEDGDWCCVDLTPVRPLKRTVPLAAVKADAVLRTMTLVREPRLSVQRVTPEQFTRVLALADTAL
jgi:predicted RNA-binding protein with PUA-like domain